MGWLGWSEQQTLDTSIPAIFLAWEGRQEMMGGGVTAEAPTVPVAKVMSGTDMLSIFKVLAS